MGNGIDAAGVKLSQALLLRLIYINTRLTGPEDLAPGTS
ncbi:hypothetical protein RCH21_002802 [Arthrobacter sp. PL16]|nr:hypothetical protein [Arthrobacter sp. PL16]